MLGAIIGDIVGSVYEWNNIKTKDFPLLSPKAQFTDDTVMTVAVAKALLSAGKDIPKFQTELVKDMRELGRRYPDAGYGGRFSHWLTERDPKPYNSFGNGSAMRVSPCPMIADSLEETEQLAEASAAVTHNHPEGIKGAKAIASAIWLARSGADKEEIREHIRTNYYPLKESLDEIRPGYRFNETCQGSVPQAIQAFLESADFEDALRNAISIGGDSDTIADMTGAIAWAYYGRSGITEDMRMIWKQAKEKLSQELLLIVEEFCRD